MDYNVLVRNKRRYPVRIMIGRDASAMGIYRVLKQYETYGPLQVEQSVFDLLVRSQHHEVTEASVSAPPSPPPPGEGATVTVIAEDPPPAEEPAPAPAPSTP